ncbi:competence protein CoiA [Caryophanon latum]|uniref:Competence protein CoiA n=1 Tax=Caryophanon latum TaxID=33977 RepID=A0A1C0YX68_9BACL|nr:competence protein CoiA family protein [Caryophanon latum]OCS91710.1 hypothetical protein A6K76_08240 [Caryophanon latum]
MFVAITPNNEKYFAFNEDKNYLYSLAKAKKLFCPHCQKNVFFRGGAKKIHHFYHERHVECSFVGEPETQEHLGGKLAVYNWLKETYPNAYIALEERITQTNQIADVYADFGNGHKFAFEIQCAEQTAEKWLERRKLYAIAGIKDIWLFGANYYKEIKADDLERDEVVLRLKYQQQIVNDKERSVYFIDVENRIVRQIGKFFGITFRTETRFVVKLQEIAIEEMKIAKIQSPCQYVLCNTFTYEKIQQYLDERKIEAAKLWNKRKEQMAARMYNIRQKQLKQKRLKQYQNYLNNFSIDKVLKRMSHREQVKFRQLVKDYGFNDRNFPGIFNIQMENYHYIHTPYPLWQLLVFHKAITHNYSKKQLIYSKYLFQDLKEQLRYDVNDSKEVATLIHSYLILLEKCGFLDKQTVYRKYIHPFKIEHNVLPIVDNKALNSNVAMYYSEFNLLAIGWADYYDTELFFTDEEQAMLESDTEYYQNLILHNIQSPLHIEKRLVDSFLESMENNTIEFERHEKEFVEHLYYLVMHDKFISRAVYDTFFALIEEKSYVERTS